jgi:hypothetical protein
MTRKVETESALLNFVYTLVGSIPMIVIGVIGAFLLYNDYRLNNNNFFGQSRFFSNVKPHDFFINQTCSNRKIEGCESMRVCGRYFTDHVITESEAQVLLK